MSDVDAGSNPASTNESAVADVAPGASTPSTGVETPATPSSDAPPVSAREALTKAFAAVDTPEGEKPAANVGDNRDPVTGKFTAKTAVADPAKPVATADQLQTEPALKPIDVADAPPSRFTKPAQAEWAKLPPVVKQEVKRLETELTQGIEKYRTDAEAFQPMRPYHDLAKQYGVKIEDAMANYVKLDHAWASDPVQAFFQTCQKTKVDPQQLVQAVVNAMTGQPQQQADPRDTQISAMAQELAAIKGEVGQVKQTYEQSIFQQHYNAQLNEVSNFAANHPYFNELMPTITDMVEKKFATDLSDAYEKAVRLNPEIAAKIEADNAAKVAPKTNGSNPKANLSITGAPSMGSNPATKPAGSPREALERAFASL
jgi:hypothetical protein